jgi:hypothetical protein
VISGRRAHLPSRGDVDRFLRHLRYPTRASAMRAAIDGVIVTSRLRTGKLRPLLVSSDATGCHDDPDRSILVAAAVDAGFGLIPVAPTCLRRSVTLLRELRRLHLGGSLHIGVRKDAERVDAHAWVQVGSFVVNDDPGVTETYAELAAGDLERLLPLLR